MPYFRKEDEEDFSVLKPWDNEKKDVFPQEIQTNSQSQLSNPSVLDELYKINPKLITDYKNRIAEKDASIEDAKSMQGYGDIANVIGKGMNDFSNSQKRDVILRNRMQDLGKKPEMIEADRPEYKDSISPLTKRNLDQANSDKAGVRDDFKNDYQLEEIQRKEVDYQAQNDPNSQVSQQMREHLKYVIPNIESKLPNFNELSAARVKQILPDLYKKYEKDLQHQRDMQKLASEKSNTAQSSLDRLYAKQYLDWNTSGKAAARKNIDRLKNAKALLEKRKNDLVGTSGRVTGRLPDLFRSEESIALRQDVHSSAVGALRATLGAQFTENEGERIMAMSYDEKLSPDQNIAKIDAAIRELEEGYNANDSMTEFYEGKGSLKGFKSQQTPNNQPPAQASANDNYDGMSDEELESEMARKGLK